MMPNAERSSILAADEQYSWQVCASGADEIELDLQRVCFRLTATDLRTLAWLTVSALGTRGATGLHSRASVTRFVHRCPHTGVWTLRFDQLSFRFRLCEFSAFAAICRRATTALVVTARAGDTPASPSASFSLN